jgi:hypothetical protein
LFPRSLDASVLAPRATARIFCNLTFMRNCLVLILFLLIFWDSIARAAERFLVDAEIRGKSAKLLVDTASTGTLLFRTTAEKLGFSLSPLKPASANYTEFSTSEPAKEFARASNRGPATPRTHLGFFVSPAVTAPNLEIITMICIAHRRSHQTIYRWGKSPSGLLCAPDFSNCLLRTKVHNFPPTDPQKHR